MTAHVTSSSLFVVQEDPSLWSLGLILEESSKGTTVTEVVTTFEPRSDQINLYKSAWARVLDSEEWQE